MNSVKYFTEGSILKSLSKFMLLSLAALLMQAMYGAVDLWVVGKFGTTAGISGVATGGNILNMFTFVLGAMTVGITILMGQYLGSREPEKIRPLLGHATAFYLLMAVIFSVLMVVFARPLSIILQAPEEALDLTATYVRICGFGFIFILAYNFISSIFRGLGNSNLPLLFVSISCVANVIGDLIFVAGMHMNVQGAAIATVIAQALSVILSLVIIRRQKLPFEFHLSDIKLDLHDNEHIRLGMPIALQSFLTNISFLAICAFINRLGLDASSGYGVAQKTNGFVMLIPLAILQCMSPFVAQNVGAKKEDRARKAMFTGMEIGAGIGIFLTALMFFKGDLISSIFTNDPNVIAQSADYLKGLAPEAVLTSILFSFNGYFNGHSKSMFVFLSGITMALLIRLPLSYIMSIQPDPTLFSIGFVVPVATVIGIVISAVYYIYLQKHMKREKI